MANISWGYTNQGGRADPIEQAIKALGQNTLFVVAAGNTAQRRDGDVCGDLPACFRDFENVITVVGLDRSSNPPRLWSSDGRGSNWSREFSLGAIAKDVLSTTYKDFTGTMSGTSQAAPQVTAAASLIYSVYQTHYLVEEPEPVLLPIRIKNRLIYTSDLFNQLLDKSQGGAPERRTRYRPFRSLPEAETRRRVRGLRGQDSRVRSRLCSVPTGPKTDQVRGSPAHVLR